MYTLLTSARDYIVSKELCSYLLLRDDAKNDFTEIPTNDPNAIVVGGLAPEKFTYQNMNNALRFVLYIIFIKGLLSIGYSLVIHNGPFDS